MSTDLSPEDPDTQRSLHWVGLYAPTLSRDTQDLNALPTGALSIGVVLGAQDFGRILKAWDWMMEKPEGFRDKLAYSARGNPFRILPNVDGALRDPGLVSASIEPTGDSMRFHVAESGGSEWQSSLWTDLSLSADHLVQIAALCWNNKDHQPSEHLQELRAFAQAHGSVGAVEDTLRKRSSDGPYSLTGVLYAGREDDEEPALERDEIPDLEGLVWGTKEEAWLMLEHLASEVSVRVDAGADHPEMCAHRQVIGKKVGALTLGKAVSDESVAMASELREEASPGLGL